jgi:hypothetical protein
MRQVFDQVLLLCPEVKTGGPEALHQLGHQIARHGGTARMVYYAPFSRIEVDGDILRCHAEASPMPAHFTQYHPQVLAETRLTRDTLVVFPEPLSRMAAEARGGYQRALWWLSLDNALPQNPELTDEASARALFADPDLIHFHQSDYAMRFLRDHGAAQYFPLTDYTDPQFVHRSHVASENPPITERRDVVCFFPNKGGDLAARFLDGIGLLRHPIEVVPIRDMTKAQVRDTLFGARLYLDFGHHPGKDRVPREAAIAGAVVLLHDTGAARCFPDHPLPGDYKFTEADIETGALHRRVDAILDDPAAHVAAQRVYRQAILLERERFDLDVRGFFFHGV